MKINQLIKQLEHYRDQYGDLEVSVRDFRDDDIPKGVDITPLRGSVENAAEPDNLFLEFWG